MNKEQWQEIKQLYHEATKIELSHRQDWVKRHASCDETCEKVIHMLNQDENSQTSFMTNIVNASAQELIASGQGLKPGDRIEQFSVVSTLGEGGMGSVYLAQRADGEFEQQVAIKVIHPHKITQNLEQRFRQERKILAELNHKNIARLIGGGVNGNGLHYIVMEYVSGLPITDYCQQEKLGLEARLSLFKQVLSAISYAHQNLVVHRDIKPSNVIVTADGDVKLLDFGIAKLLDHDSQTKADETQFHEHAYTHSCAAPEQVLKQTITTQTDIYGLGALLMQMLCGETVFDLTDKSNRDIETHILESTPEKPSVKCKKSEQEEYQRLAYKVKGDIDTIVLKALNKDPAHRYVSPGQFSEDIDRYLNNYPIVAKPESPIYTSVKFVQRNVLASSLASAFILSLLVFSGVVFYQSTQIEQERNRAISQADVARQTTGYLTSMFRAADPNENHGEVFTAKMLVDQANKSLSQLDTSEEVKAELLTTLASVYNKIGNYENAQTLLTQAQSSLNKVAPNTLNAKRMNILLNHEIGDLDVIEGRYDEAIVIYKQQIADLALMENLKTSLGFNLNYYLHAAHYNLASALTYSGQDEASLQHYEKAIKLTLETDLDHNFLASGYFALGHTLRNLARFEESRDNLLEGIRVAKQYNETPTLDLAHGLNQLASTLYSLNEYDKAIDYALEGLKIRQDFHQGSHVEIVSSMGMVANIYARQGKLNEAIEIRKQSLVELENSLGKAHPFYAIITQVVGRLLLTNNELIEAENYLIKADELMSEAFSNGSKEMGQTLMHLGHLYLIKNQNTQAYNTLSRAIAVLKEHAPAGHYLLAQTQAYFEIVVTRNGSSQQPLKPRLDKALAIFADTFSPDMQQYQSLVDSIDKLLTE